MSDRELLFSEVILRPFIAPIYQNGVCLGATTIRFLHSLVSYLTDNCWLLELFSQIILVDLQRAFIELNGARALFVVVSVGYFKFEHVLLLFVVSLSIALLIKANLLLVYQSGFARRFWIL